MKPNISKLRRETLDRFTLFGEALRKEGVSDQDIIGTFNRIIDAKIKTYYSRLRCGIEKINIRLDKMGTPADSKAEVVFLEKLRKENIPFKFQYKISPYRVDFLINEFLVVEIDGPQHSTQKEYDKKRDSYIESYGYTVVRYPIWLIAMDINAVIEQIKETSGKI